LRTAQRAVYVRRGWKRSDGEIYCDQPEGRIHFQATAPYVYKLKRAPLGGVIDLCGSLGDHAQAAVAMARLVMFGLARLVDSPDALGQISSRWGYGIAQIRFVCYADPRSREMTMVCQIRFYVYDFGRAQRAAAKAQAVLTPAESG